MIQEFAVHEVEPTAIERDVTEYWDMGIWHKASELGLAGIPWSDQYGGAGADYLSYIIAIEELCKVDAAFGVALATHCSLVSLPIYTFGTEEQKLKYLSALAAGSMIGANCYAESGSSYETECMHTTAVLQGDEWVLNGTKHFIVNGEYAKIQLVFAQTDPHANERGISAFIVENPSPGLTIGKKINKMGIRSCSATDIHYEECRIPKENLLGQVGDGYLIAALALNGWWNAVGAGALGIAQGAFDRAIAYAKGREQFGKSISKMQAIQFKLADMATQIDAARLLIYQTAWYADNGIFNSQEGAMAKQFASDMAMEVTIHAIQIHGGYGYMREYAVERYMRDAKFMQMDEGIHNLIIRSEW